MSESDEVRAAGRILPYPAGDSTVVGVVGDPVSHSLSPLWHNAAFAALGMDWLSVAFRVPAGALGDALADMRAFRIRGLSVTMPHKEAAAGLVDECTPLAKRLGAVNCITNQNGWLVGDSTDGAGFLAALSRSVGFDPRGRRCLVLGAGGAARAVILALAEAGSSEIVVVNRSAARAVVAAELAGGVGRVGEPGEVALVDLVVQATPLGMDRVREGAGGAGADVLPFDPALLHAGQLVTDLVYHPAVTPLMTVARERGASTVGGLGMLVHQAALALERWTGEAAPVEPMWAAVSEPAG